MGMPKIATAIPKRRYQLGEFSLVVLGDIESQDGREYQYLMGVIPEGKAQPELFVSAEKQPGKTYLMRVMAAQASQDLEQSPNWNDLESFCLDATLVLKKMLSLMDEEAALIN
jgi:hypothetical protein